MTNFISYFIECTKEAESPTEFWRWAAISTLCTTMRNNVFLHTIIGTVYPNMYVVLFADSGIVRKAPPCKFAMNLIRKCGNTKIVAGRASMQQVIRELGQSYTNPHGVMIAGASALMYSEELSSMVVNDPATIPLLIDLYDYHTEWGSYLVSSSTKLKEVCLSLLAASNSELFQHAYTDQARKGGLLGRTLIIREEQPRHKRSLFELARLAKIRKDHIDEDPLLKHLYKLSQIRGEINISIEAEKIYDEWYHSIPKELYNDKIGYGSRLGTHVLKVSMGLAAARKLDGDKIAIEEIDIQQSVELCQSLIKNYRSMTVGIGASPQSYQGSLVIKALLLESEKQISRAKLLRKMLGETTIEEIDKVLLILVQAELVREVAIGRQPGYQLTEKGFKMLVLGETDE